MPSALHIIYLDFKKVFASKNERQPRKHSSLLFIDDFKSHIMIRRIPKKTSEKHLIFSIKILLQYN
jgi:hypothetical protein